MLMVFFLMLTAGLVCFWGMGFFFYAYSAFFYANGFFSVMLAVLSFMLLVSFFMLMVSFFMLRVLFFMRHCEEVTLGGPSVECNCQEGLVQNVIVGRL